MRNGYGDIAVLMACGIAMLLTLGAAQAQGLQDPTRPPGGVAGMPSAAVETESQEGLRAVVRHPGKKPAALINGELVPLGGLVSGSRLIRIGEDSVVLEGPSGRVTLVMTPGIAKTLAKPGGKATAAAGGAKVTTGK